MANALRLPAQRGALADEPGAVRTRGGRRREARSAGTTPGERVHPEVVEAMAELGIDLGDRVPRALNREDAEWADVVVTMGCGDECHTSPASATSTGTCPIPKITPLEEIRATRGEIARRVAALAEALG